MALPNLFGRRWMDTVLEERPTKPAIQQGYIGSRFFPTKPVYDYELTWDLVKSANHLAGLYSHDGVPIPGRDPDYETYVADVMHAMASRMISRNVVLKLRQAGELSTHSTLERGIMAKLRSHVGEKLAACEDEIDAIKEYLCLNMLQGSITWPPQTWAGAAISPAPSYWGNVTFTMSTGYPSWAEQDATSLVGWDSRAGAQKVWSDTTDGDPVKDLEVIAENIEERTGLSMVGATILMNRTLLSKMAFNANILRWIRGDNGPADASSQQYIDVGALKNFIKTKLGYTIELYDAQWTYDSGLDSASGPTETRIKFLKPGRVLIIPRGVTGAGVSYYATAPDMGAPDGQQPGRYTWSWEEDRPPWKVEVGAGLHGFPILRQPEGIFVLDALS